MRLQGYGKESTPHPSHMKSDWNPPVQLSVALETSHNLLSKKHSNNCHMHDKAVILKKADRGTTSVMMSRENKINEGLALLNERNNYQPLT